MARSRTIRPTRWLTALALLPLAVGACDKTSTGPAGNTTVSLYIKDAPGDVDSVWVQINDVVLMSDSGNISLLQAPTDLINLTTLQDSAMELVSGLAVDPGAYHQLRFILGGAVLLTSGGEIYSTASDLTTPEGDPPTGTLQCPSCAQSGLKVSFPGDVTMDQGSANGILLDFDVTQSFGHQAGNSGKWVMHPVIHGHVAPAGDIAGGNTGGSITGTVVFDDGNGGQPTIPQCDGNDGSVTEFVPMATGSVTDFSGQTAEDSTFVIGGLDNDTYTLGYQAETTFTTNKLVWTASVSPATATIDTGNTVSGVIYTISAVSCDPIQ